ncbi:unnamed protein product [Notodromas monacha]|uniref:receptor protein serine/threonine kinase n=1 Tax=Notodromas monacha TaxID=399045 RepID=A0A7R9BCI1_9CRUS|nr:unnamed protein product [Notodromas monacha]CAG0912791.1 unnamed protein product [Notodromas monacha]
MEADSSSDFQEPANKIPQIDPETKHLEEQQNPDAGHFNLSDAANILASLMECSPISNLLTKEEESANHNHLQVKQAEKSEGSEILPELEDEKPVVEEPLEENQPLSTRLKSGTEIDVNGAKGRAFDVLLQVQDLRVQDIPSRYKEKSWILEQEEKHSVTEIEWVENPFQLTHYCFKRPVIVGRVERMTEVLYMCSICKRTFQARHKICKHLLLHTRSFVLSCDICDEDFADMTSLMNHLKRHELRAEKPRDEVYFLCDKCPRKFLKTTGLFAHKEVTHQKDSKLPACRWCDRPFPNRDELVAHLKAHKEPKEPLFFCIICNREFVKRIDKYNHEFLCMRGLPGTLCDICDRRFPALRDLREHEERDHGVNMGLKLSVTVLASLSFAVDSTDAEFSKDILGLNPGKCEEITIPMCRGIKYNLTRMPNAFNHETQNEAAMEVQQFWPLVSLVKCSSDLQFFLCSIYTPICMEDYDHSLPACRSVCLRAKAGCAPLMKKYGFVWPERMNCDSLPNFGDPKNLCMDYENGTLPVSSSSSASSNNVVAAAGAAVPTLVPSVKDAAGTGVVMPLPPPQPLPPSSTGGGGGNEEECSSCQCRPPFVKLRRNSGVAVVAGVVDCGLPCNGSALFTRDELAFADAWIPFWALLCGVSCLVTVTTFAIDPDRFRYPERATIVLSGCYLMVSAGYVLRLALGKEEVACVGGAVRGGASASGHAHCAVVFVLVYFFTMAAAVWWVVLSVTWFLAAGLKWGTEAISACSAYFHVCAWLVPGCQTVVALFVDAVEGDGVSGLCVVSAAWVRYLVVVPLAVYLSLGMAFLLAGSVALWRIRRVILRSGDAAVKACKLETLMVRVGVFGVLYFVPAAVMLTCWGYELGGWDTWVRAKACSCGGPGGGGGTGPSFAVIMCRHFMTVAVGISSGVWVWSGKTVASWRRFYGALCGRGSVAKAPSVVKQAPMSHQDPGKRNQLIAITNEVKFDPTMEESEGLLCFCSMHCPDGSFNGTCRARPNSVCFAAVEQVYNEDSGTYEPEYSYGCLPPDETGLMQCRGNLVPHLVPQSIECCKSGDMCNQFLTPAYDASDDMPVVSWIRGHEAVVYAILALTTFLVLAVVALIFSKVAKKNRKRGIPGTLNEPFLIGGQSGKIVKADLFASDVDETSGSGSGMAKLVQQTVSRQVQKDRIIGQGRYGKVWLGHWRGEPVALKMFNTTEEASWRRENEIYETPLIRHENVLGFIASDIRGDGSWTQMILITEYHPRGSLYDYLQENTITVRQAVVMGHSIAAGLTHLHTEIIGTRSKPAIAHRDLKSRNILVKRNGICCIADFGLAVKYDSEKNEVDIPINARVGTRRYMAPELLTDSLNSNQFPAFVMADIYALGLVLWELCRRCLTGQDSQVEEYQPPYFEYTQSDPSIEEMLDVVCVKQIRPSISPRWNGDKLLMAMSQITQECWKENPFARLTALRIKKTLAKLKEVDPAMSRFDEAAEDIDMKRLREKLQRESEENIRSAHHRHIDNDSGVRLV